MELGKGLQAITAILEGGNHPFEDEKAIARYIIMYLVSARENHIPINNRTILIAYDGAVKYAKKNKEIKESTNE